MGKVLKILTVFVFVFTIIAFVLGLMNFKKRELLIGRTHVLEERIIALAATLESRDLQKGDDGLDELDAQEWDVDEVSDKENNDPQMSDFWGSYRYELEGLTDGVIERLNLNTQQERFKLRQYYFLVNKDTNRPDYQNGVPKKDMLGRFQTTGEGTMNELLDKVQSRADAQQKNLLETRTELRKLRMEFEGVIEKLNSEKVAHRASKAQITKLENKIGELEAKIEEMQANIDRLNREKLELQDKISEQQAELTEKQEQLLAQETEIARLKEEIQRLSSTETLNPFDKKVGDVTLSPGEKGSIVKVDSETSLVIIKLTDEAMKEIFGEANNKEFQPFEMMVYRKGFNGVAGEIITRVRVLGITRDGSNLAEADLLYGWGQYQAEKGDKVVY